MHWKYLLVQGLLYYFQADVLALVTTITTTTTTSTSSSSSSSIPTTFTCTLPGQSSFRLRQECQHLSINCAGMPNVRSLSEL